MIGPAGSIPATLSSFCFDERIRTDKLHLNLGRRARRAGPEPSCLGAET